MICSRWADQNYWKGGWRSWLANRLVDISNIRWLRWILP